MDQRDDIAVLFFNLGGPDTLAAVEPFLVNLFSDREIIELPGGDLPAGEGDSYALPPSDARLALTPRPLDQAVTTYVDWLRLHPAAQGRSRG